MFPHLQKNNFIFYINFVIFIHLRYVCICVLMHVEVKGQLAGLGSLLLSCMSREQTQLIRLGRKVLFPVVQLTGLKIIVSFS